jgi:hypothetical protein
VLGQQTLAEIVLLKLFQVAPLFLGVFMEGLKLGHLAQCLPLQCRLTAHRI